LDQLIGNREGTTVVQEVERFAMQLANTAPIRYLSGSAPLFATEAALVAAAMENKVSAWVYDDPDPNKNGVYGWAAGTWVRALPLPYSFAPALNAGTGTGNAIEATTRVPLSDAVIVLLPIVEPNAEGGSTVSFNGGSPLAIKTSGGSDPASGGLVGGMIVMGIPGAATFRLVTDQASAAIVAQAEGFASQAETFKNLAAAYAAALNLPAVGVLDQSKALVVKPDGAGYEFSNMVDYSVLPRVAGEMSISGRRIDTNVIGNQNHSLFVCRMAQYTAARIEVTVFGSVAGVSFGQVSRSFDVFRASPTDQCVVRPYTPEIWTQQVKDGVPVPVGFFDIGFGYEQNGQIVIAVNMAPTGAASFIVSRARITGEYVSFGALNLSQLNRNISAVSIVPVTGQSNAQGYSSRDFTSRDVLDPGRAQMFNKGLRLINNLIDQTEVVPAASIAAIVDAHESMSEDASLSYQSLGTTFMAGYLRGKAATHGVVMPNAAVGAQPYATLKKGTVPYTNLLNAVARARAIVGTEGRGHRVPVIINNHGESDGGDTTAAYLAKLIEWQSDYTADLADGHEIPFLGSQYSHGGGGPQAAWLAAALTYPSKFILAGARYNFDYVDAVHLDTIAVARHGYYLARAYALWEAGEQHPFMYIESAIKTGNQIIAKVHLPIPGTALVLDTTEVTNPGGAYPYGLRYEDSAGQTITGVAISGADEILITLSGAAAATGKKLYVALNPGSGGGGRTIGPRSNFRDNNQDKAFFRTIGTYNLFNWLVHQTLDVT